MAGSETGATSWLWRQLEQLRADMCIEVRDSQQNAPRSDADDTSAAATDRVFEQRLAEVACSDAALNWITADHPQIRRAVCPWRRLELK